MLFLCILGLITWLVDRGKTGNCSLWLPVVLPADGAFPGSRVFQALGRKWCCRKPCLSPLSELHGNAHAHRASWPHSLPLTGYLCRCNSRETQKDPVAQPAHSEVRVQEGKPRGIGNAGIGDEVWWLEDPEPWTGWCSSYSAEMS